MKKQFLSIFVLLFSLAIANAQKVDPVFTVNGINYRITSLSPNEVEVAKHESFTGVANIPATVSYMDNSYTVSAIGEQAFLRCLNLTSVSMPNTIKTIKYAGFFWCGITSISIPKSVTVIGDNAFGYCRKLTSVLIPNGVVEIGKYAFFYCENLKAITIGSSVEFIGYNAFAYQNPSHVYCLPLQAPYCESDDAVFYPATGTKVHICVEAEGYGEEGEYWQNLLIVKDGVCNAGITEIEEAQFAIFPNPAANYFTLQIEENHLPQTVQIINLQGQIVQILQVTNTETKIDVSSLSKGVYFVKTELGTKKLLID